MSFELRAASFEFHSGDSQLIARSSRLKGDDYEM
jgi:hypothetical protein